MTKGQKKSSSFSLGWIFVIVIAAFLGLVIWGMLDKSDSQVTDEYKADGSNHPHTFSYSPDESTLWLGTHKGIYESRNGKWIKAVPPLGSNDVMGLEINPNQTDTMAVSGHGFVKRTTDGGKTWEAAENGLPNKPKPDVPDAHQLTMNPRDPNHLITLLAGKGKNLFETKDGGQSWKEAGSIQQDAYSIALAPDSDTSVLVATETGIYRYDNINGALKETKVNNEPAFQLLTLENGSVFAVGESGILMSKDLKSWNPIHVQLNGKMPLGIEGSRSDDNKLLILTDKLTAYESTDSGNSWSERK
ncbi:hypothetical protein GK047_21690 [Paenibacillus sp. SYP-B3998]|uniref:Photosynthesis system II assembly factor Ycf48/Hcf136-like domain-containing protein n=1 Tax=Paenibacillus sp. SYP-B3998 TaxID=2678564 RepID=A0A6G4A2J8_9BACL|nr:hypothetical protein [Paenibacillus sp. SYP-B3998]NEW08612.1 hypothetical protein [Paenibacillus sp. SYP-B3998]